MNKIKHKGLCRLNEIISSIENNQAELVAALEYNLIVLRAIKNGSWGNIDNAIYHSERALKFIKKEAL